MAIFLTGCFLIKVLLWVAAARNQDKYFVSSIVLLFTIVGSFGYLSYASVAGSVILQDLGIIAILMISGLAVLLMLFFGVICKKYLNKRTSLVFQNRLSAALLVVYAILIVTQTVASGASITRHFGCFF